MKKKQLQQPTRLLGSVELLCSIKCSSTTEQLYLFGSHLSSRFLWE